MALTGIDPSNPLPRVAREFVFGAGVGAGVSDERKVILMGNKTSSGSATADTVTDPIENDADAQALFGPGSELDLMYRAFMQVPQQVEIRAIPVAESGGSAATVDLTFTTASDSTNGWRIKVGGLVIPYTPASGDAIGTSATGLAAAINAFDSGRLPITASAALGVVTVTFRHKGTRGTHYLTELVVESAGANAQSLAKGSVSAGTTEDDHTAAITELGSLDDAYYVISAKTATSAPSATDNGLGELQTEITAQALPVNGKDMRLFYGLVGTSAEAITVPPAAPMNSPYAHGIQLEDCPLLPGQIAAYVCAVVRAQEIAHPGANCNGFVLPFIPAPLDAADHPTSTEQVSQLNNGVTPLAVEKGRVILKRFITNRCLNDDGTADYKTREGHIASVAHFTWNEARQRWANIRQPFSDYDPAGQDPPTDRTTTPASVVAMWEALFDDLGGSNPLSRYAGPILAPSRVTEMKERLSVVYDGAGRFPTTATIYAVQHNLGTDVRLEEASPSY